MSGYMAGVLAAGYPIPVRHAIPQPQDAHWLSCWPGCRL